MREVKMITGFLVATDESWTGAVTIPKTLKAYRKAMQCGEIENKKCEINGRIYTIVMDKNAYYFKNRIITAIDIPFAKQIFNSILVFKTKGAGFTDLTKKDIDNIKNNLMEAEHEGVSKKILAVNI